MTEAVLLDFDDTLCYTNCIFTEVREEYNQLMKSWGLWDEALNQVMNDFDVANVHKLGHFSVSCFPDAFGQAYRTYCEKFAHKFEKAKFDEAVSLGYSVFSKPIRLMPDAEWLIKELKADYKLYLVTHGDKESQLDKINRSGLAGYFDNIYLLEKKSERAYEDIASENSIDKAHSWMVGNSLRYDVDMSLKAGYRAIHLVSDSWAFDDCDIHDGFFTAYDLKQVYALINEHKAE